MKLSEDQVVVDALKNILQNDYPYLLEYDEVHSSGENYLVIKKVGEDRAKGIDSAIFWNIIKKLENATGKWFTPPGMITTGIQSDPDKDWGHFVIRERK